MRNKRPTKTLYLVYERAGLIEEPGILNHQHQVFNHIVQSLIRLRLDPLSNDPQVDRISDHLVVVHVFLNVVKVFLVSPSHQQIRHKKYTKKRLNCVLGRTSGQIFVMA